MTRPRKAQRKETTPTSYSGTRSFPAWMRDQILARDDYTCQLRLPGCTIEATVADHLLGRADAAAAGLDPADIQTPDNGVAACVSCNETKRRAEHKRGVQRWQQRRRRPEPKHPGLL